MKKISSLIAVFYILLTLSCSDLLFNEDPENTNRNNLEIFYQDYKMYYSHFDKKGLNWDSLYSSKKSLLNFSPHSEDLFKIMGDMILTLEDGHADLYSPNFGRVSYDYAKNSPVNKLKSVSKYVALKSIDDKISYGIIHNQRSKLGYVAITSFQGNIYGFSNLEFEKILKEFKEENIKGLIIDVRDNTGGQEAIARSFAKLFYDKERVFSYVRFKRNESFTSWIEKKLFPPNNTYIQPIIVLTNKRVYSSTESFVLAMKVLPHVKIVGDTTGGGSGNPIERTLPNGFKYRIPIWQEVDANKNKYEGIGIFPDIPIWITQDDIRINRDVILERAILELNK